MELLIGLWSVSGILCMVFFVDAGAEGLDGNGKNKMIDDGYEERGFADGDGMVGVGLGVVETSRL